jgi:hypothetical protein
VLSSHGTEPLVPPEDVEPLVKPPLELELPIDVLAKPVELRPVVAALVELAVADVPVLGLLESPWPLQPASANNNPRRLVL